MIIKKLEKVRQYWNKAAHSRHCKMSRGAEYVMKIMMRPHGDNWRRHDKKK